MLGSSGKDIIEQWSQNPYSALTGDKHITFLDKTQVKHKKQAPQLVEKVDVNMHRDTHPLWWFNAN